MRVSDILSSVIRPRPRVPRGTARPLVGRTSTRLALAVLLVSLAAAMAPGVVAASNPAAAGAPAEAPTAAVCGPAAPGYASCLSLRRTDIAARSRSQVTPLTISGYGPSSLQAAYNLTTAASNLGKGETVAVVDAYDQPTAVSDVAAYRSQYGLPKLGACPSPISAATSPCFEKVNETGGTTFSSNTSWGVEIDLDIDMVSAICPNCNILLVEANTNAWADLGAAEDEAVALGAVAVSNSYGGSEGSSETTTDTYYNHPGVAVTASSGDGGYGVLYPAASPDVVAVGGTTLNAGGGGSRDWTETAWNEAGSGCSAYESKPTWQADYGCAKRTVADASAVADPNTGVAVYDTTGYAGWIEVGGTSVASPIIASTFALAGAPATGTYPGSYLYHAPGDLYDVTSGSNGSCSPAYICTAEVGYDGPTGLGTPDGTGAFTWTEATAPDAPMNVTASAGNAQATVSFSPPAASGGGAITSYTVTSTPGSKTATGTASPITVTGLTNGTPYTFTVTATNGTGSGEVSAPSNSVTPSSSTAPLTITTTSLASGRLSRSYSATLKATGGVSPYTWAITSGALPNGLTLAASTGTISGTPTTTGTVSFTVTVTDSAKTAVSKALSITISRR